MCQRSSYGTIELKVPSHQLSSLIIAVHCATQRDVYRSVADSTQLPSGPAFHAELADYDCGFARTRFGLDHAPIAAVTIVHAEFIVDVTFDVADGIASALFVDAGEDAVAAGASRLFAHGAHIMAARTAHALEAAGLSPLFTSRSQPPGQCPA